MLPATGSHDIVDPSRQPVGDILGQQGDSHLSTTDDGARIRGNLAGQKLHEGRFAGAVAAHKADPFTGLDLERHPVEQRWSAEGYRNIVELE